MFSNLVRAARGEPAPGSHAFGDETRQRGPESFPLVLSSRSIAALSSESSFPHGTHKRSPLLEAHNQPKRPAQTLAIKLTHT
jgi:hypothetical protein